MEPSVSPELEEESIIIVYAGLETGLYATNMERGGELRVFELPGRAFIFGFTTTENMNTNKVADFLDRMSLRSAKEPL